MKEWMRMEDWMKIQDWSEDFIHEKMNENVGIFIPKMLISGARRKQEEWMIC